MALNDDKLLWEQIEMYRRIRNITQKELATRIGVTPTTYSNYRACRTDSPLCVVRAVVRTLNIPGDAIKKYMV